MKKENAKTKIGCMVLMLLAFCLGQVFAASCGDVNSSGGIDIIDALMIAQYSVGLNPQGFNPGVADVSKDGTINIIDALQIAQYYVGLISSLSGCATSTPTATPTAAPTATAIPTSVLQIAVADGYAAGTTGGAGGATTTVTTAAAFKSACESSSTMLIIVDGNLGDVGQVNCKSNKTIIGKNSSSGYKGNLALSGVSNIIIQNLNISNPDGVGTADGIEATNGCTKIFVTKCTFSDCADGSYDIKRGSDYLTVSWCRFRYPSISGHNFANLIGHDDANGSQDRGKLHITMHHNWYDAGSDQRMPRVRFGTVHVYNNYYSCSGNSYCIGTGFECHIKVEACYFDNVSNPWNDINGMANGGEIGWNNLRMVNTSTPSYAPNKWPVFTPSYSYTLDNVDNVKSIVLAGAGNR